MKINYDSANIECIDLLWHWLHDTGGWHTGLALPKADSSSWFLQLLHPVGCHTSGKVGISQKASAGTGFQGWARASLIWPDISTVHIETLDF